MFGRTCPLVLSSQIVPQAQDGASSPVSRGRREATTMNCFKVRFLWDLDFERVLAHGQSSPSICFVYTVWRHEIDELLGYELLSRRRSLRSVSRGKGLMSYFDDGVLGTWLLRKSKAGQHRLATEVADIAVG